MPKWESAPLADSTPKWASAPLAGSSGDEVDQGELAQAEKTADTAIASKPGRLQKAKQRLEDTLVAIGSTDVGITGGDTVGALITGIQRADVEAAKNPVKFTRIDKPDEQLSNVPELIRKPIAAAINVGEKFGESALTPSGMYGLVAPFAGGVKGAATVSAAFAPAIASGATKSAVDFEEKVKKKDTQGAWEAALEFIVQAGGGYAAARGPTKLMERADLAAGELAADAALQGRANRAAVNLAAPGTVRPTEERIMAAPELERPAEMVETQAAWKDLVPREFHPEVTEGIAKAAERIRLAQQRATELGAEGKLPEGGQEFVGVGEKPGFAQTAEERLTAGEQEMGRETEQVPVVTESTPLKTVENLVRDALEKRDWVRAVSVLGQTKAETGVNLVNRLLGIGRGKVSLSSAERTIFDVTWDEAVKKAISDDQAHVDAIRQFIQETAGKIPDALTAAFRRSEKRSAQGIGQVVGTQANPIRSIEFEEPSVAPVPGLQSGTAKTAQGGGPAMGGKVSFSAEAPTLLRNVEAWADDVLRGGGTHAGPDVIAAYIVKGAFLLARGATDFATWSREMIKEHGPGIRPILRQVFDAAKAAPVTTDKRAVTAESIGATVGPETAKAVAAISQELPAAAPAPITEPKPKRGRPTKVEPPPSAAEAALTQEPTTPVERRPQFRAQPGDEKTISQKLGNAVRATLNASSAIDKAVLPIDAVMDILGEGKGTYDGWLFKHIRGPLDDAFNRTFNRADAARAKFEQIVEENNLGTDSAERIGVYANVLQGQRARMIKAGVKPEVIDRIVKSMRPEELMAYDAMREAMDKNLPAVQSLMKKLYDVDVKSVENYFPMPRDWEVFEGDVPEIKAPAAGSEMGFDEMATLKALTTDLTPRNTTKTRQGMTITRKPGARTPIKINSFEVFRQHIQDVSHLLETQESLKTIGELVRKDIFREKYGDVGQKIILDFLDTVAKQGGVESFRRWKILDMLRRNLSASAIAFRPVSQIIHLSNVPLAMSHVGPDWYFKGFGETMTQKGQKFLRENFRETFERSGGEPAQSELKQGAVKRVGFAVSRGIDLQNSQATVMAAYMRELARKGLDPNEYASLPVDTEAVQRARVLARRAVASPLPKDIPQAISRGALTAGNVSLGRSMLQFGNILLDQWSNIRLDLVQAGLGDMNPRQATKIAAGLVGVLLVETGIRMGGKEAIQSMTGTKPKKEETFPAKLAADALRKIPFVGHILNAMLYHETGVPVLDSLVGEAGTVAKVATAKKPEAQQKALIRAAGGAAQLLGVPGSGIATELIEKGMP